MPSQHGSSCGAEMLKGANSCLCITVVLLQLFASLRVSKAEVFAVGGAAGWTVPRQGIVNYTEWASMLTTLSVGDTLLFTYNSGEHNVVEVREEDFHKCRSARPLATYTDGQTMVYLQKEGQYRFICGFKGHCALGQKFVVDVVDFANGRAPAPAPVLPPSTEAPTPGQEGNPDGSSTSPSSISPAPSIAVHPLSSASSHHVRRHVILGFSAAAFITCYVFLGRS